MSRTSYFYSALLPVVGCVFGIAGIAVADGRVSDPTRPPASTLSVETARVAPVRTLELSAVFFAHGRKLAIINGRRVSEQDEIESARVQRIHPDRVVLSRDGKTFGLELVAPGIRSGSLNRADSEIEPPSGEPEASSEEDEE